MMSADFATAAGFAAPFEEQYAKMSATLREIVTATQAETDKQARATETRSETAQVINQAGLDETTERSPNILGHQGRVGT